MGMAIHPEVITESQVLKLFRTYGNQNITKVTKDIRNHYIQAYYLYEQFNNALKGKGEGSTVDLKLSDLDYIDIKISRGNICISDGDNVIWIPKDITDKIITKIKG